VHVVTRGLLTFRWNLVTNTARSLCRSEQRR
jgi:hypothetical protein